MLYSLDTCTFLPFVLHSSRVFEHGPTPAVLGTTNSPSSVLSLWQRLVGADSRARSLEWYWRCRIYPLLLRALGVLLTVVSLIVVWSECTFFVREPRLSVIAAILHSYQTILSYNLIAVRQTFYLQATRYFDR